MTSTRKLLIGMLVLCGGFGTAFFFRKDTVPIQKTAQLEDTSESTSGDTSPIAGHLVLRHPSDATPRYAMEGWPTPRSDSASSRTMDPAVAESDLTPTPRQRSRLQDRVSTEHSESFQPVIPPSLPNRFPRATPSQYGARPVFGSIFFQEDLDSSAVTDSQTSPSIHRVQDGDTLRKLAERYLGNADRADEIYQWNKDRIENPDLLPIGIDLRLPTLKTPSELQNPEGTLVPSEDAEAR